MAHYINNCFCHNCQHKTNWSGEPYKMVCDSCRSVESNLGTLRKSREVK